jgi:tetratricopeptide (TPR) repeat protein
VGFKEGASGIELPDKEQVTDAVKECIGRHVERQIYPRVAALEKKLKQNPSAISYRNKLAVVYARYGLYDKALEQFQRILYQREYTPALTNTGNIYFIRKEYQSALKYYNRALEQNSRNRSALVGIARCNHELENYGLVKKTYEQIKDLDPDLAERYAYLDLKGGRADRALDAAGLQTIVVWQEEE